MLAETDVVMVGGGLAGSRDPLPADLIELDTPVARSRPAGPAPRQGAPSELDGGAEPRS